MLFVKFEIIKHKVKINKQAIEITKDVKELRELKS